MWDAVLAATDVVLHTAAAAVAAASLGDFDNLQTDQLDLGAAVLQHLLSAGQHLVLHNDTSTNRNSYFFGELFFCQISWDGDTHTHIHTLREVPQ